MKTLFNIARPMLVAAFVAAAFISYITPGQVSAVSCSGSGCNGKSPVSTGCSSSAYLAKQLPVISTSTNKAVSGVYTQVYYSKTCGTNWVRVNKNPFCGVVYKRIDVAKSGGYIEVEKDKTCGASYSMMVYAPGSTPVQVASKLYDTYGRVRAYTPSSLVY